MGVMDDLGLGSLGSISTSGMVDTIINVSILMIGAGIVAIVLYYVYERTRYKHYLIHIFLGDNNRVFRIDKAKEWMDRDKVLKWKTLGTKEEVPIPPVDVLNITHKGKNCVIAFRTANKDFVWAKISARAGAIPKEIEEMLAKCKNKEEKDKKLKEWGKKNNVIQGLDSMTANHRGMYMAQLKKAKMRSQQSLLALISPYINLGIAVVLLFGVLFFIEDIAEVGQKNTGRMIELEKMILEREKVTSRNIEVLEGIRNDVKEVKSAIGVNVQPPPV